MSTGTVKTKVGLRDVDGTDVNPATGDNQTTIISGLDAIEENQTDGSQITKLNDCDDNPVCTNYPLAVDGDSVYVKDINLDLSDIGTFTGTIESLFSSTQNEISDSTATNPKTFTLVFIRPITTTSVGIASKTGNFSNVKLIFKTVSGDIRHTIDDSANNTKYTSQLYSMAEQTFDTLIVEFHTADTVDIAGLTIPKIQQRTAIIKGLGEDGLIHNARVGVNGVLYTSDYLLEVAKGNIPGEGMNNKFGANPEITTGTDPEDIWDGGGLYTFFPTTAQAMETVSSDANDSGTVLSSGTATGGSKTTLIDTGATFQTDTVAAGDCLINDTNNEFSIIISVDSETQVTVSGMSNGFQECPASTANVSGDSYRIANANDTGAAVVGVYGLDGNWLTQNEFVVLNGTTAVDLANTYIRMNRAFVVIAGSSGGAEGTLITRIDGGGTTAMEINDGNNQTLMTVYSIPANRTAYFLQGYVALSKGGGAVTVGANFSWRARIFGGVFAIKGLMTLNSSGSGWWKYDYKGAPGLPPRSDIVIRCDEVTATIGVVAGMPILLIHN